MKTLAIDIETYSSIDLRTSGVFAYTEADDFEILLFAYAFDEEEIQIVDLAQGEEIPRDVVEAIFNPLIIKTAFNAQFERTCLSKHLKRPMPAEQWRCSQVHSLVTTVPDTKLSSY